MDTSPIKDFEVADIFKSWVSGSPQQLNLSRDFWMPDKSCRVCYDCDSQFTIFNRRHHCRLCGRVFCSSCTANSIPVHLSHDPQDRKRIRVCNYCFKQRQQDIPPSDTGIQTSSPSLSPSPSTASLVSANSCGTPNSTGSAVGYQRAPHYSEPQSPQMGPGTNKQDILASGRSISPIVDIGDPSPDSFGFFTNRSDDDDEEYGDYRRDSEGRHLIQTNGYYGPVEYDEKEHGYGSLKVHSEEDPNDARDLSCSPTDDGIESQELAGNKKLGEVDEHHMIDEGESAASIYGAHVTNAEPVDFESNVLFFLPPEPENEEDEREAILSDDDDDGDATGEWGYLRSSNSFGSGEYRSRDRSTEEHRNVMKNVVDGHFRALVTQLLQVEDLPVGDGNDQENWLEIITSLSWEAATLLKPDTSKGGGMDPGGYVKIKCLACGHPTDRFC